MGAGPLTMSGVDRSARLSFNRVPVRDEMEQQYAKAVHIGRFRASRTGKYFRREIERRAREVAGSSDVHRQHVLIEIFPGAEVHEDRPATFLAHDVVRLDVAVQKSRAMNRRDRTTQVL